MRKTRTSKHPVWKQIGRSAVHLAIGLIIGLGLLWSCQGKMVYFPTEEFQGTPHDLDLAWEVVDLTTSDGVKLHAWFVPAEAARATRPTRATRLPGATILLCHGNGGNISYRLQILQLLHNLGLNVFIFDYRGYGKSEGSPDEEGTYLDAEAAWKYLTESRGIPAEQIVIHGRSLGGAIASHLAVEHTPGALIVDSSFTALADIGQEAYPFLPVRLLIRFDYTTSDNTKKVRCPVLVIHSPDDEIVPFHHGQEIFAAAPEPKRFLEVRGGHNDNFVVSSQTYSEGVRGFIDEYVVRLRINTQQQ